MISWSYYGLNGFKFLFGEYIYKATGNKNITAYIYYTIFIFFTIVGASSTLDNVIAFSDMMVLTLAFPNITGLLILAPEVSADMKDYIARYKAGLIKRYK